MTFILLAIGLFGLFFLLLSLTGLMFPFFFFLIPLVFLFRKPTVRVYTRTFDMNSADPKASRKPEPGRIDTVIDADYTERPL